MGENELRSTMAATLAHVLYEQGRDDDGGTVRARARRCPPRKTSARRSCGSALAKVLARRDGSAEAAALAQEAVALAATTDMLSLHGAAVLDLARVHAC